MAARSWSPAAPASSAANLADRLARRRARRHRLRRPGAARRRAQPRLAAGSAIRSRITLDRRRHPRRASRSTRRSREAGAVFHFAAQVAVTTSLDRPARRFRDQPRRHVQPAGGAARARRPRAADLRLAPTRSTATSPTSRWTLRRRRLRCRADPDPARARHRRGRGRSTSTRPTAAPRAPPTSTCSTTPAASACPTAVLRMSCIYGPRQMGTEDQGWVAHFLIRALARRADQHLRRRRAGARRARRRATPSTPISRRWRRIDDVRGQAFNLGGGPDNAVSLLPGARPHRRR